MLPSISPITVSPTLLNCHCVPLTGASFNKASQLKGHSRARACLSPESFAGEITAVAFYWARGALLWPDLRRRETLSWRSYPFLSSDRSKSIDTATCCDGFLLSWCMKSGSSRPVESALICHQLPAAHRPSAVKRRCTTQRELPLSQLKNIARDHWAIRVASLEQTEAEEGQKNGSL